MAGNLSHSECTCENPNLDVLAFRCVTFLRKLVWLQRRGHSVLGMEASHPHRTTTLFWPSSLWLLQKCSRGCYLITATAIWSPLLPFLLLRRSLGIFRNINLYFSEKHPCLPEKYSTNLADTLCEDTLQSLSAVIALKPITSHFSHHHDFLTSQSMCFNKDLKTLTAQ